MVRESDIGGDEKRYCKGVKNSIIISFAVDKTDKKSASELVVKPMIARSVSGNNTGDCLNRTVTEAVLKPVLSLLQRLKSAAELLTTVVIE